MSHLPSWKAATAVTASVMFTAAALARDNRIPLDIPDGPGTPLPPILGEPAIVSHHPAHVLVRFRASASPEAIQAAALKAGVESYVFTYHLVPGLHCVRVAIGNVDRAIGILATDPSVMYAERDHYRFALAQELPYGIPMVGAPVVWAGSTLSGNKGAGARVAVLDTGVDLTHPDLPVPVLHESFIPGQTVDDYHDHGTHCSGTVLALDNDIGVVGVAPECSLMIGKVLSNGGSGPTSGVMAGCQWASDNGANVISMSLGGGGENQAEADLYAAITDNDVLIVAAAGNSNSDIPSFPGSYPSVVCVAAVDSNRNRAGFSNFGQTVDISGPGVSVLSTIPHITLRDASHVSWEDTERTSTIIAGSGEGNFTAQAIFCGIGNPVDFPPSVAGNIAHVRRGGISVATLTTLTFREKADNAIAAGAIAVIVSNNTSGNINGTLQANLNIPVVGIQQAAGDALEAISGVTATVIVEEEEITRSDPYAFFSGTSMATPHVAGVAGLLTGLYGPANITAAQLRTALETTAEDLGDAGRDDSFGHGLVRADLAKAYLDTIIVIPSPCPADFNSDGVIFPDDLSEYITCFFLQVQFPGFCPRADFNGDGVVFPDDLSEFITTFFLSVASGC